MPFSTFDYERADLRARLASLSLEVKLLRLAHGLLQASLAWSLKDRDGDVEGPGDTDDEPGQVWGSVQYAQAGESPRDHNRPPEPLQDGRDDPPDAEEIPDQKPTGPGVLSSVLRLVSERVAFWGGIAAIAQSSPWIAFYLPEILANTDPPKTFEDLLKNVGSNKPGYQDHHIVEQTSAARDGFPRDMIDGKENVVKIPTLKHREITAWYGQRNPNFNMLTPRAYLAGKSWEERYQIGIDQLIQRGILKP